MNCWMHRNLRIFIFYNFQRQKLGFLTENTKKLPLEFALRVCPQDLPLGFALRFCLQGLLYVKICYKVFQIKSNQIFIARRLEFIQYKYHIEKYVIANYIPHVINFLKINIFRFFRASYNVYFLYSLQFGSSQMSKKITQL